MSSLPYEKRKDGILFHLRDEVKMLLKWSTSTKVVVEMWRGHTLMPPDTGNLNSANFREKLAKSAKAAFVSKADGKDAVPNILEDIGMVALAMGSPVGGAGGEDEEDKGKTLWDILAKDGPMALMIKYAKEGASYFHPRDGSLRHGEGRGGPPGDLPVAQPPFRPLAPPRVPPPGEGAP